MEAPPDRLEQLTSLLSKPILSCDAAEEAARHCGELLKDGPHVLAYYVLKCVFSEVVQVLDGEAITPERHEEVTGGLSVKALEILHRLQRHEPVDFQLLERFVDTYVSKINR